MLLLWTGEMMHRSTLVVMVVVAGRCRGGTGGPVDVVRLVGFVSCVVVGLGSLALTRLSVSAFGRHLPLRKSSKGSVRDIDLGHFRIFVLEGLSESWSWTKREVRRCVYKRFGRSVFIVDGHLRCTYWYEPLQ
jgi:hypothetical protein